MSKPNLAILFGGCSAEYKVSLQSAAAVIGHLDRDKYNLFLLGITPAGDWYRYQGVVEKIAADSWHNSADCRKAYLVPERSLHGFLELVHGELVHHQLDAALPVLHGPNGEDGTVQGLLELAGITIIGCGSACSAWCMDKMVAHRLAAAAGVKTARGLLLGPAQPVSALAAQLAALPLPLIVKPLRAGSSLGISCVYQRKELDKAVAAARRYDETVIVEEKIEGFEVGCAIVGQGEDLLIGELDEIETPGDFFDYEEKYTLRHARIHMPARLSPWQAHTLKQTAAQLYRALGCRGFARVDLFLTRAGDIVFNEINTIPGFTAHSRFPNMMRGVGLSFDSLLETIIERAVV